MAVRSLLRRKFLLAVEGPSGTTNRWHIVSRASVDDFQQRFVSLKALSIERKKKPAVLALELYAQGIRPIDIGTKGQRIFKLADL